MISKMVSSLSETSASLKLHRTVMKVQVSSSRVVVAAEEEEQGQDSADLSPTETPKTATNMKGP